nr:acyl-CoA dehydrogenase [Sphingobium sp.]
MHSTLREQAPQTERGRQVPAATIDMFREADLFRVMQPTRFGGFQYDVTFLKDLIVELGRGCASSAWVYALGAAHQWLVANFPLEAQEELWSDDPNNVVFASYAPATKVQVVSGGYRISGTWSYLSGIDHSRWAMVGALFPSDRNDNAMEAGLLLVPSSDYVIEDQWYTYGLCGTGSKDIMLEDVFVPAHRTLLFADASSGKSPGSMIHDSDVYRVPFLTAGPTLLASPAVGAAMGALDSFIEMTAPRTTRGAAKGGGARVAEFAMVQSRVAEAASCLDAAYMLMDRDCRDLMQDIGNPAGLSPDIRIRTRRNQAYAVRLAVQAMDGLNSCTGAGGLFLNSSVQRAWRDVNAIAKHITLNWDSVMTMAGQHMLGLEPKGQY